MKTITNSKLIFENASPLDPRAFTTMGISAKESDSAIGYFGTGLKYAIAIILRENCSLEIHSHGSVYAFRKTPTDFRGKDFDLCQWQINGGDWLDLPFTTDLGKNWEPWMAYRELSSNCLDEGGVERIVGEGFGPSTTSTTLVVRGEKFLDQHRNRDSFFITGEPIARTKHCDIYATRGKAGRFFKGVRVGDLNGSCYTYNVHSDVELTEDRTCKYSFEFNSQVVKGIALCDDAGVIRAALESNDMSFEGNLDWSYVKNTSVTFDKTIVEVHTANAAALSATATALLKRTNPAAYKPKPYTPTSQEAKKFSVVKEMFESFGMEFPPIEFTYTDKTGLHGFVIPEHRVIYITNYGLARGVGELAATLFEEYNHAVKGMGDFERAYQDYLQMLVVNFIAEKTGAVI